MNIQMILSALPASHSGTSQPGADPGHFARALGQAAQATAPEHGHTAAFGTSLPEGLPSGLAGHEALLQALHAAGYSLNGDGEAGESDARLDEIMQRLELITADHGQVLPGDELAPLAPLPEAVGLAESINDSAAAAEAEVMLQALAAMEPRQLASDPQGELRRPQEQTATLHSYPTAESLGVAQPSEHGIALASAATRPADNSAAATIAPAPTSAAASSVDNSVAATLTSVLSGAEARSADSAAVTTLARAGTVQITAGELAALNTEAPRGGFVTEAMTSVATSTSSGQSAPTAQPGLPAQTTLSAPVQSQAWSNQLGQQLVQFARQGGEQHIEMRLNPAELGPLSVSLKMTEQGAQAQFLSAHAPVRQVLEQAIPQLREALAEQGITLGEASVGEQRQQNAQAFAGGNSGQGRHGAASDADLDLADGETLTPGPGATVALDGRVDLYA